MREIVKVFGHQRSGNHYLNQLLKLNFEKFINIKIETNHKLLKPEDIDKNISYIYIIRNREAVLKSLFRMKDSYGLDIDSYENFISTRYCDMWSENIKSKSRMIRRIDSSLNETVEHTSEWFRNIKHNPIKWYNIHCKHWVDLNHKFDNIYIIYYEEIIKHFNDTLGNIRKFLGIIEKIKFKDVKLKIGPSKINDNKIHNDYIKKAS